MINDIGYLYIIKDVKNKTGWIKIGKTTDPIRRLKEYNNSFPEDRMTYTFLSEPIYNLSSLERELVEFLQARQNVIQSRYEWFKWKGNASRGTEHLIHSIIQKIDTFYDTYAYYEELE